MITVSYKLQMWAPGETQEEAFEDFLRYVNSFTLEEMIDHGNMVVLRTENDEEIE